MTTATPGYRIVVPPGALDVDLFTELRRTARAAFVAGDWASAARSYAGAMVQWSGEALADLRGFRFAGEFATAWEEERLSTIQERIECDFACGRHAQVVGELFSLTNSHPLRESFWGQLIKALNASGRQADALDAARRLRTILADELGIDPSQELQDLEQRVLLQQPEPPRPAGQKPIGAFVETITELAGPVRGYLTTDTGSTFPVTTRGVRVGRLPDNEIVLAGGRVSRYHAILVDTGTAFMITDMNSTNGTIVNGERVIGSRQLMDRDRVTIGDSAFTFRHK